MKLPKKDFEVKIGPFVYEVKYSQGVSDEGECFGSTHNNRQVIYLQPDLKRQKTEQTFIHEIMHACDWVSGLLYRYDSASKPTEEEVVREMSMVFYQVLTDNPKIFGR